MSRPLWIFLFLTFVGPAWMVLSGKVDFHSNWRFASRASSHIAPNPDATSEAVIQVYAARAFSWRGLFAVHMWIATKAKNAKQYTVYHVVGWRLFANLPVLLSQADIPDRYWFNQKPEVIRDIRGQEAEAIIPEIEQAAAIYPYPHRYDLWPGPNSNTFIAYLARQVPELKLTLPSNAIGKDYLPGFTFFARAPSGTGYQFSLFGILGIMLALKEGIEINLLGLVYGVSPLTFTIKLPGFGDIQLNRQ